MKRKLQIAAILFSVIAALLTWASNTDSGRIICKEYCLPRLLGLSAGIDKLFQQPNKYRNKNYPPRYSGKWNFFYLQNGKDKEFKAMKNFILSNHYTRQLGYEIKAIMQYQAAHSGGDAMNPQFNVRPVFFIKKTESNKELDFGKPTDADLLIKDAIPITTEAYLTQNLDTYFGNCLRTGALVMIIIASVLNSIGALIKESLMGKDELSIDFEEIEKAKARQENPHLKEYHNKLKELMQSEVSSKDNFINWITGLSGGTLLFIFAQNKQLIYTEMTILCAGRALFFAIISAILFKIFLNVSYGRLRLEVKLSRILWEGHEFKRDAIEEKKDTGKVCKKTEERLKRNLEESIKVLDPKHKEKTVMWSFIGYKLLDIFYLLTVTLFISGFICMGVRYFT